MVKNKLSESSNKYGTGLFLFFTLSAIHLISLVFIYFNINFLYLLIVELFFFIYKKNYKKVSLIKIIFINLFVFLINIFYYEGEILFEIGFLKITKPGLIDGIKKIGLLFGMFIFTNNILKNNKEKIIEILRLKKSNLIFQSINYFFYLWEVIGEKVKLKYFLKNIIKVYHKNKRIKIKENSDLKLIDYYFIFYNVSYFALFISILILILFYKN